ncbi:hypothetical protein Dip510_001629 [Elusimicrobium posterum]
MKRVLYFLSSILIIIGYDFLIAGKKLRLRIKQCR